MKITVSEVKSKLNRINNKSDSRRKKISELEDITIKSISNATQNEKKTLKKEFGGLWDNSKWSNIHNPHK